MLQNMIKSVLCLKVTRNVKAIQILPKIIARLHQPHNAVSNEERRTKNEERRTKNEERRTKNEERRTKNPKRVCHQQ
jgi:hypothetical protein